MRQRVCGRMLAMGLAAIVGSTAGPAPTGAQIAASDRAEKWQFYVPINFFTGEEIDGAGGSFVDLADDVGWGFGFGYNFSERFMLGFETTWIGANYDAGVDIDLDADMTPDGLVTVGGTLDAATFQGIGQLNVLERSVSPFVRGNLGFTYADSNIPNAPAEGVCWWDPWWGYVCDVWQPTFDTTAFSYGGGLGFRADLGRQFFLEASFNMLWIDFDEGTPSFSGVRLNMGGLF